MYEVLSIMAFLLAFAGIFLGSDILRRTIDNNQQLMALNERLFELESDMAEQKQSNDASVRSLRVLERRAQEAKAREMQAKELKGHQDRVAAQLRELLPQDMAEKKQGAA